MKITFLGAANTVTGSKHLVETSSTKVLIDCGLYQGLKELRLRNWAALPIAPQELDAVILTHAHIDHSGYLPLLVRNGFKGPVFCSEPTRDLCKVLLPDCGKINEEDTAYANRSGFSKHKPALPLYTEQEAFISLNNLQAVPINSKHRIGDIEFSLEMVGHILGATCVKLNQAGNKNSIMFSGDVGRYHDLLEHSPPPASGATYLVVESTYGDRLHSTDDPIAAFGKLINTIVERQSVLLIPSFALGRAQVILYCIYQAFAKNLAPKVPVYINSPMATQITNLYKRYPDWHRLSEELSEKLFSLPTYVRSVEESVALNHKKGPLIIISASGMLTGGRILHHLKACAPDARNIILLPGFQAEGTRGAALINGSKTLKIHGGQVTINAQVHHWDSVSAHGDQQELLRWITSCRQQPQKIFLVHGDKGALQSMRQQLEDERGFKVETPTYGSSFTLS